MPKPRKALISLEDTPYYHCVSRCVRRAFLCGEDSYTGQSYEHRRQWVEDRLHFLVDVFAIELCAYAVMSNHTHVVLHVNKERALNLSDEEVVERWHKLYKGTHLSRQFSGTEGSNKMSEAEKISLSETIQVWRNRLWSISWFMRALNETIARKANQEDKCSGRFWDGRFKSQALLDEAAVAACMAYVDLNPIRAKMADTPETSNHTSIQYRINAAKAGKHPSRLLPFVGNPRQPMPDGLPFVFTDYIELVDRTGRAIIEGKHGRISPSQSPILERLHITSDKWLELARRFEACFRSAAGTECCLKAYQRRLGQQKLQGISHARRLLDSA